MPRNRQLTQREVIQRQNLARRGFRATTQQKTFIPRGRIAQRQIDQERKVKVEAEKTKKEVEKIIDNINAGKITNISQIPPQYRQYVKVTQEELNQISKYYAAKRYEDAYNKVMGHYKKGMLWAVAAFGEGLQRSIAKKLIKEGYAPSKLAMERETKQRTDALKSIREGQIAGVKIIGNRIIGPGNKPITLSNALKKQAADEIDKTLPVGDKLIVDKNYNIKGISSGLLGQSIPYTQKSLNYYSKKLSNLGGLVLSKKKPTFKEIVKQKTSPIVFNVGGMEARYNKDRSKILIKPQGGRSTISIDSDATTVITKDKTGLNKDIYFVDGLQVTRDKFIKSSKSVSREFRTMLKDYTEDIDQIKNRIRNNKNTNNDVTQRIEQIKADNPGLTTAQLSNKIEKELTNQSVRNVRNLVKDIGELFIKTAVVSIVGLGFAIPGGVTALWNNPIGTIKKLPSSVSKQVKQDIGTVMSGDVLNIAQLGVEYYTVGKLFQGTSKATRGGWRMASKLSPRYVRAVGNKFIIRKAPVSTFAVKGKTRYLKTRVQKPSFKRPFSSVADFLKGRKPGQFKKFTKDPGLILKEQTVKTGAMPFAEQMRRFSGKEVTAVNAAADQLTSWLKRKNIIRKPIMRGKSYLDDYALIIAKDPTRGREVARLLKKFDNGGKLTINEIVKVSAWMKKNVAPNITLLERSLYVDPSSGFRISRLRISPERTATLRDLFKGNFKLKGSKPQVLIFEKAQIAKVPKRIQKIANKIDKKGLSAVSEKELAEIIQYQMKVSTKFKIGGSPIYAGGIELEATAYGVFIKRLKQVGFRYIEGKKVTFVKAELWKPTVAITKQLKMARLGKLSKGKLTSLERLLSKKLGRKIKVETPSLRRLRASSRATRSAARRGDTSIPVLRLSGTYAKLLAPIYRTRISTKRKKVTRRTPTRKKVTKRTVRETPKRVTRKKPVKRTRPRKATRRKPTPRKGRPPARPPKKPSKRPPRKPSKRPPTRRPPARPPRRPPKSPPTKKPPIRIKGGFKRRTLSKQVETYYVVEKVRGKFKKLYPKPLTVKGARDFAVYSIDNHLSKTAFFVPLGKAKKVVQAPKKIQGYYSRNRRKVRPYKIKYGRKKLLVNGFIEKRKYFQDTKTERLQAARLRAKSKKKVIKRRPIRKVKRKATPAQLRALKKARAVRKRKKR